LRATRKPGGEAPDSPEARANVEPTQSVGPTRITSTHLEAQSIYILREGLARMKKLAVAVVVGKDST